MTTILRFEVCAFNIQSALIAQKMGAYRVELCDNPVEGGTTPSYGAIKQVREKIDLKLYPIIRPRAGNYWYDDDEFAIMLDDIRQCRDLGCDGISVGVQRENGEIDVERFKLIVETAYPLGVTSNRVFDATPDPAKALEDLISAGCERVLTSGQQSAAPDGAALLADLVQQAAGRISIMPGAGINSSNIAALASSTGAFEFHGSARRKTENSMSFANPLVLDFGNVYVTDEVELGKILTELKKV
jgi:copper homeostasis protein